MGIVKPQNKHAMLKGFKYWKSPKIKSYFMSYWAVYILAFTLLVWLSIQTGNAFIFIFLALVPYASLLLFRVIRKPFYQTKGIIEEFHPVIYQDIMHKSKSLMPASPIKESQEEKIFVFTLIKFKESIQDQEVRIYAYNTNSLVISSMVTLSLWFFGSFLIILTLAL